MKYQSLEELQGTVVVHPEPTMTRTERLERWAQVLEKEPSRRLSTLEGTEYLPLTARDDMRSLGSPVTVAFADPVLRAQGLAGETYGEAKRFFDLTDRQLHGIVCYCHHGSTISAGNAARIVRAAIDGVARPSVFAKLRAAYGRLLA